MVIGKEEGRRKIWEYAATLREKSSERRKNPEIAIRLNLYSFK